jgi:hypothetical protein
MKIQTQIVGDAQNRHYQGKLLQSTFGDRFGVGFRDGVLGEKPGPKV